MTDYVIGVEKRTEKIAVEGGGRSARSSKLVAIQAHVLCISPKSTDFLLILVSVSRFFVSYFCTHNPGNTPRS